MKKNNKIGKNCLPEELFNYILNDMGFSKSTINSHIKTMNDIEF
jgi:hypothetical protein